VPRHVNHQIRKAINQFLASEHVIFAGREHVHVRCTFNQQPMPRTRIVGLNQDPPIVIWEMSRKWPVNWQTSSNRPLCSLPALVGYGQSWSPFTSTCFFFLFFFRGHDVRDGVELVFQLGVGLFEFGNLSFERRNFLTVLGCRFRLPCSWRSGDGL
jgi:hypothetical protein